VPSGEKTPKQIPPAMEANKWKPGQSGNPSGRPKKLPITDRYASIAELPAPEYLLAALKLSPAERQEIKTYGDALALNQFRAAIKGKTDAAREITDRLEGRARQALEVSGPEGGAIDVQFMSDEQLDARIAQLLAILDKEKARGPQK
jgi:Family of unknown function (DUF5681)